MLSKKDTERRAAILADEAGTLPGAIVQRCPCGHYVFPINCAVVIREPDPLPSRVTMTIECPFCERQAEVDVPAMRFAGVG